MTGWFRRWRCFPCSVFAASTFFPVIAVLPGHLDRVDRFADIGQIQRAGQQGTADIGQIQRAGQQGTGFFLIGYADSLF